MKPESAVNVEKKVNQSKILNATINLESSQKLNGKVLSACATQQLFTSNSQKSLVVKKINFDADPIQLSSFLVSDSTPMKIPRRK